MRDEGQGIKRKRSWLSLGIEMHRWTDTSKNWKCSGDSQRFNSWLFALWYSDVLAVVLQNHASDCRKSGPFHNLFCPVLLMWKTAQTVSKKLAKNVCRFSDNFCCFLQFLTKFSMYRLERMDWQGQAELLKQQTLTTLSERDQQVRQLTAMLEEAQSSKLRLEHTQRQVSGYNLLFKYSNMPYMRLVQQFCLLH